MIKMNENTYYANVGMLYCRNCGGESIISIEKSEKTQHDLCCPYCGSQKVKITARTTDENRADYEFDAFTLVEHIS